MLKGVCWKKRIEKADVGKERIKNALFGKERNENLYL